VHQQYFEPAVSFSVHQETRASFGHSVSRI
jgi:hypothetical protein